MGRDEKMSTSVKSNNESLTIKSDDDFQSKDIQNMLDKVMLSIISDARKHNGGNLKIIKPVFKSKKSIAELDCDKNLILKMTYLRKI